jgi:hypothetical protein
MAATCSVLRCAAPADHAHVVTDPIYQEAAICDDHHQRIEAGQPWLLSHSEPVILMGADLPPRATTWRVTSEAVGAEGVVLTLRVEARHADGSIHDVEFTLDKKLGSSLGVALSRRYPPK